MTYLLQAAQEWQVQCLLGVGLGGYQPQVYAMDSVFLRARSLFEFFLGRSKTHCHAGCLFGLKQPLSYPAYNDRTSSSPTWECVLHIGSLHIKAREDAPRLIGLDGTPKDLNEMPVDFAKGILKVWSDFEAALKAVDGLQHNMAVKCREQAIADSHAVVDSVQQRADKYAESYTPNHILTKVFSV
ncbi:hypothetical protein BST45_10020 [Mycobacterium shinjukuense]|nr:hypothetical protein BST45_10020 [Mycobacterium shinjukuense]